jgi:hypothetical protein
MIEQILKNRIEIANEAEHYLLRNVVILFGT